MMDEVNPRSGEEDEQTSGSNRISNPRWRRYFFLFLSSLIQFSAVSNVRDKGFSWVEWSIALQFGIVLFLFSGISLFVRFRGGEDETKPAEKESLWEGYWLVASVFYSLGGTAFLTRVGAIGYAALNVYFASWMTVVASIATLNQWSTDRDILSIDELTSISLTLKSWWMLLLMGILAAGTSLNFWLVQGRGLFGVSLGLASAFTAAFFISTHYNLLKVGCAEGGWAELFAIVGLCIIWTIGTAIITQESGIGATIGGSKRLLKEADEECVVYHRNETIPCAEWISSQIEDVPGSNLYLSSWISLLAAVHLVARWKAQQALQFADARQQENEAELKDEFDSDSSEDEGDEVFEDASMSRDSL